jgi:phosphate acetyltransferase
MLSFSTDGSAKHDMVTKVRDATQIAQKFASKQSTAIIIEGEMQLDSAVVPDVAMLKSPDSKIAGTANILIFPDLNSGNI